MIKIAYIFTATGRYSRFVDDLVISGTTKFFPGEKTQFITFTDDTSFINKYKNLTVIQQNKLGWPFDTLMRFHLICNMSDMLSEFDYIFYGNANMVFNDVIGNEILPDVDGMVATIHPMQRNLPKVNRTYERNPNSLAYVKFGEEGDNYYQGCFFGGTAKKFLEVSSILRDRIQIDADNGIIPIWWDESHMNKYFIENKPKELHSGYAYPEKYHLDVEKKIIQLDKSGYGGHDYLRV